MRSVQSDVRNKENVLMGLECCMVYDTSAGCYDCPYFGKPDCSDLLGKDAISLLKAQEPTKPEIEKRDDIGLQTIIYTCGNCGDYLYYKAPYCPSCGRPVKWNG